MADISVEEVWNRIACSDPVLGWKEHGQTVQMQAMSGDRYVTWEEDFFETEELSRFSKHSRRA